MQHPLSAENLCKTVLEPVAMCPDSRPQIRVSILSVTESAELAVRAAATHCVLTLSFPAEPALCLPTGFLYVMFRPEELGEFCPEVSVLSALCSDGRTQNNPVFKAAVDLCRASIAVREARAHVSEHVRGLRALRSAAKETAERAGA